MWTRGNLTFPKNPEKDHFLIFHADIADHTNLFESASEEDMAKLYRVVGEVFRQAVEIFGGRLGQWSGDGGYAAFPSRDPQGAAAVRCAATAFLLHGSYLIQRYLELLCEPSSTLLRIVRDRGLGFWLVIDHASFMYDPNNAGYWCGQKLAGSFKTFKTAARLNKIVFTKRAFEEISDPTIRDGLHRVPRHPHRVHELDTQPLLHVDPTFNVALQEILKTSITSRNNLTEAFIGPVRAGKQSHIGGTNLINHAARQLYGLVHQLTRVPEQEFRVSVWSRRRGRAGLKFLLGLPSDEHFTTPSLRGKNRREFADGEGLNGRVCRTGEILVSLNMPKEKGYARKHSRHPDRAGIICPIRLMSVGIHADSERQEDIVGVVSIGFRDPSHLKRLPADKKLLEKIIEQFTLNMALGILLVGAGTP